jgi:hypothetical protein
MNADIHQLKAFHAEHGLHDIALEMHELEGSDDYLVACALPISGEQVCGQASDCFAALQTVRRIAEDRNWMICCKGARRNVWPSGMSRSMGGGIKAYTLEMGRQATLDSLVNIFDADAPELYSSVADQEVYANAWFKSLCK